MGQRAATISLDFAVFLAFCWELLTCDIRCGSAWLVGPRRRRAVSRDPLPLEPTASHDVLL